MKKSLLINYGRKLPLPLNIQMFAGEADDFEKDKEVEIDYKAEYEKMKSDYEKIKNEKDKASKEASDFKKQLRAKESDEEAKKRLEEEKQEEINKIIADNNRMKLERNLSKDNILNSQEVEKICEARVSEDNEQFARIINEVIKNKIAEKEKELLSKFRRDFNIPGGSTSSNVGNEYEAMAKSIVNSNVNNDSKDRFGAYFRK